MNKSIRILTFAFGMIAYVSAAACEKCRVDGDNPDFKIKSATVTLNKKWGQLELEIIVEGQAGRTVPKPVGKLDGAPVLGYVFPTTLKPEDIGFNATDGIVAMALTSHPDFDDTPLWDEDLDGNYVNASEGIVWHPHWVILVKDDRVPGGLSVKEYDTNDKSVKKPSTAAPGMNMYMDSPGFQIVTEGNAIRMTIPTYRVNNKTSFKFDAVACYMGISAPEGGHGKHAKPMLGVYTVYSILSKNLSLPYSTK
ncbi:hypothetical protein [Chryseolinea lacunae]|uniref:Uncharacterized protein n=1 Tax=Chryseolinea lacunae TaxID=2801331 RepID=A0ABS1KN39_9BACT|nr:hypothetical protein [Chryseolinea lacunae]MBL0740638.1 hypothetical protein [Chryseolinea lacunae]